LFPIGLVDVAVISRKDNLNVMFVSALLHKPVLELLEVIFSYVRILDPGSWLLCIAWHTYS
jgi:hypothetical protein